MSKPADTLDTAVALFVYRRPEPTRRVFARIRAARPARLFVIADGPKHASEAEAVDAARRATDKIDWPCEVERDYADANLGLGRRVSTGIAHVLEAAGEAIFLEDDCLPEASFFGYCAELLDRYRDSPEVMMIAGFNPLAPGDPAGPSYDFTRFGGIWGWATWQRAFAGYALEPPAENDDAWNRLRVAIGDDRAFDYYRRALAQVRSGAVDTWDYQWTVHRLLRGGLCALPRCNLVRNIGFGDGATHAAAANPLMMALDTEPLTSPLRHPDNVAANPALDERLLRHRFGEPVPDDLFAACERLRHAGRLPVLLALATAGWRRFPDHDRFARMRIEALEKLGQSGRTRRERDSAEPAAGDAKVSDGD